MLRLRSFISQSSSSSLAIRTLAVISLNNAMKPKDVMLELDKHIVGILLLSLLII